MISNRDVDGGFSGLMSRHGFALAKPSQPPSSILTSGSLLPKQASLCEFTHLTAQYARVGTLYTNRSAGARAKMSEFFPCAEVIRLQEIQSSRPTEESCGRKRARRKMFLSRLDRRRIRVVVACQTSIAEEATTSSALFPTHTISVINKDS